MLLVFLICSLHVACSAGIIFLDFITMTIFGKIKNWICYSCNCLHSRVSQVLPLPPGSYITCYCISAEEHTSFVEYYLVRAGTAQSVWRLSTGWTVRGSIPGGGRIFRTRPNRPWDPHILLYNEYQIFPEDKLARAWRWPPNHLVPRLKKE